MNKEKLFCHWDLVRFLKEKDIKDYCLSVITYVSDKMYELMIFLYQDEDKYVVHVHKVDNSEEFDEFTFDDCDEAIEFVSNLPWQHPEYKERPFTEVPPVEDNAEEDERPSEKETWACNFCGTLYKSQAIADECAASHSHPVKIKHARFISKNFNATGYPTMLEVEMSDGSIQKYVRKASHNKDK